MNRSLQEYLLCINNGNDTRYTERSTDVKSFLLSYDSQITTTLGMSPYRMLFNQKPRKPIMFTANAHKNAHGYCQPKKDSICYNLPLTTRDEDHFHHPQTLKLASGTHTVWILNRDKKTQRILSENNKKIVTNCYLLAHHLRDHRCPSRKHRSPSLKQTKSTNRIFILQYFQ